MTKAGGDAVVWRHAAAFASRAHAGQSRRDGGTPYVSHPLRVALTVSAVFGCDDPETLAIACLHDTIEDTDADYEDLEQAFGRVVADGVAALTKDASLPQADRENAASARLRSACWRAKLVRLADQLDNLADSSPLAGSGAGGGTARQERLVARIRTAIGIAREPGERAELLRHAAEITEAALRRAEGAAC